VSNTLPLWALIAEADRGTGAQIVTGIITVGGTLLGAVVGLFGERWVRTWGNVRCDLIWQSTQNAGSPDSPGGVEVQERQLEATFLNHKDVPVTVWEMRVMFYKGGRNSSPRNAPT
jgi:hypothetical protein